MSNIYTAAKINNGFIKGILQNALDYEGWSLQGMGMLRLYMSKEVRIHIWDSRFAVPDVSLLHTHPWDFVSFVVAGVVKNIRYVEIAQDRTGGERYKRSLIKCGAGGGMRSEPELTELTAYPVERIDAGREYCQKAHEIHASYPLDGTVTVLERTFKSDTEHAKVYWPVGKEWVSAEPRLATEQEVEAICHRSLACWFY